jgi:hypothetical protein
MEFTDGGADPVNMKRVAPWLPGGTPSFRAISETFRLPDCDPFSEIFELAEGGGRFI